MLATLPQGDEVFVADGYIRVFQDVRGKYGSEGDYVMTRPLQRAANSSNVDHSTDAYDTIDWLVKNVPESNGRVGMLGSSYEGFTVVMALVNPHPALKVAAPMSPMVDGWMGDDWFHFGAFRQTNFDYFTGQTTVQGRRRRASSARATTTTRISGAPARRATSPGPRASISSRGGARSVEHPAYDAFWQAQALDKTMAAQPLKVPTMWIQGLWDQEDMWGAIHSYLAIEPKDTRNDMNFLVMGPWRHSQVNYDGASLGPLKWDGDTALQFRRDVLKPFFDQYLKDGAPKADTPPVFIYNTGENHWDRLKSWPLACDDRLRGRSQAALSERRLRPVVHAADGRRDSPDGLRRIRLRSREARAVRAAPGAIRGLRRLETLAGHRSARGRRSHRCADLRHAAADRAAPHQRRAGREPRRVHERHGQRLGGQTDRRLSGRSAEPAGDGRLSARRSRWTSSAADIARASRRRRRSRRTSRCRTSSLCRRPTTCSCRGHRIMVQVQSSWFPLYDRNPQTFVPNIFFAKPEDYVKATPAGLPRSRRGQLHRFAGRPIAGKVTARPCRAIMAASDVSF